MNRQIVRTACPRDCRDTCTLLVEVTDGKVTRVSGDPAHEITRGLACSKALYELRRLYSPKRLLHPVIKKSGRWKQVSWEEALALVAEKLCRYREEFGSLSVMHYSDQGSKGWLNDLEQRFFNLYGGVTVPKGSLCSTAGSTAQILDFGAVMAHDPVDVVNARTILIWGRNPAHTNIHLLPLLKEARAGGAYIVLIDPVPTRTLRFCDLYLAPRPGTDGALALGMARAILDDGLEDRRFLESKALGFDEFSQLLKDYPASRVAGITGIPEDVIHALAIRYATQKPGAILLGFGLQRYQNSGAAVRAIDGLAAVSGNIGIAGGGANYSCKFIGTLKPDITAEDKRKQHRAYPKAAVPRHILEAEGVPIKMLFVTRANPAAQLPNSSLVRKAFESVEFKVVIDLEMTETAGMADVVLPCTTFFEQENVFSTWGHNYITYGQRAILPLGATRNDWDIFADLARRLGFQEEYGESERWLDTLLKPFLGGGFHHQDWRGKSFRCPGAPYVSWANGQFKTPSGKYEFFSGKAAGMGTTPLPAYSEPAESTRQEAGSAKVYPFHLLSPAHVKSIHSQFYENVEPGEYPVVHLGTRPAMERGIRDGSLVRVFSPRGEITGQAKLHKDYRDDVILMYHGGSPEARRGVNSLTSDRISDIGNCATYFDCLCNIEPL